MAAVWSRRQRKDAPALMAEVDIAVAPELRTSDDDADEESSMT